MAEDYYRILGVSRSASQSEIQRAYRELAQKYHPDRNPEKSAKKKFHQIQAAFDVLNDTKKREMYDRYGSSFESYVGGEGQSQGPGFGQDFGQGYGQGFRPGSGQTFEDVDFGQFFGERQGGEHTINLGDLFGQFRGSRGTQHRSSSGRRSRRGRNLHHDLDISFNTAVTGGEIQLALERKPGKKETLTVKIPAGIDDGKKIRLRGQGEPGSRGKPDGDFLITVHVTAHPHFQRRGNHLHVRVPVTVAEAALGAKIDLPTPQGTVSLNVAPNTSSGTKLRIKGHGIRKDTSTGDLLAEIHIVLPKTLDTKAKESIRQFDRQTAQTNPRAKLQW